MTVTGVEIPRVVLLGNPNTGKTTLFNRLCGLRHQTANFPGTTQETRLGRIRGEHPASVIDSPGVYALTLNQVEAEVCRRLLAGEMPDRPGVVHRPDGVCVVVNALHLARGLKLVGEAAAHHLPTVVAVNMSDVAHARGLEIDTKTLAESLGVPCVSVSARTGAGCDELLAALDHAPVASVPESEADADAWAERLADRVTRHTTDTHATSWTDRIDHVAAHPVLGLALFGAIMFGLFWAIFKGATWPMDLIDGGFTWLAGAVENALPPGILSDFLTGGVIGGVGATVIFLPQIVLLFFLIALLEDSGYLARAAFLVDRLLRPFGLPGHAFVPLLSSHACAIPGIMAARSIPDPNERLATILVAPFMSCTARIPVYVLLVGLLFAESPAMAAIAFAGCYVIGILAAVLSVLLARRTFLRGQSRPMTLELPSYKVPSLRHATMMAWHRGVVFLKKAGTAILAIAVVLWWLGSYPIVDSPEESIELRTQAAQIEAAQPEQAEVLLARADRVEARHASASSFAGRIGKAVQPVFAPLGYDWQLSVGVITSFAAREVFVTTMAVITSGDEELEGERLRESIAGAVRDDGVTPVFTRATSWSLLVYYILAMQCLPTLAVTAREAGGRKWAFLQLAWMCGVAYLAALVTFQVLS